MAEHNPDYDSVLVELLSILQRIAICQIVGSGDTEQDEMINALSQRISKEDVQLYYQVGIMGRKDLPVAPDPRTGFEMTLIRMLAFRPAGVATPDTREVIVRPTMNKTTNIKPEETKTVTTSQNRDNKLRGNEAVSTASVQAEAPQPIVTEKNVESEETINWQTIIDEMALVGLVKELAGHCALKEHSKDKVHLVLSPDKEHLLNQTQKDRLSNALEMRFGKGTQLKISIEEPEAETPAEKRSREQREKQQAAESSLKEDDNVRAMEEMFGATLDEKSIRPV
jgi:DNA polymerase-3 subunit gamma/tau